jgi:hypothetical protein
MLRCDAGTTLGTLPTDCGLTTFVERRERSSDVFNGALAAFYRSAFAVRIEAFGRRGDSIYFICADRLRRYGSH